jgi:hypothetical protein
MGVLPPQFECFSRKKQLKKKRKEGMKGSRKETYPVKEQFLSVVGLFPALTCPLVVAIMGVLLTKPPPN